MMPTQKDEIEWPTIALLVATYAVYGLATTLFYLWQPIIGILVSGIAIAHHSSLQHEALHGHPFRDPRLNEALVFPALGLFVPYRQFRTTHLAHHHDPILTDPYDDPESNYFDPAVWKGLASPVRGILLVNNTLLGRITIGPLIGTAFWLWAEGAQLRTGNHRAWQAWGLHLAGLVPVIAWISWGPMPWWAYLLAVWFANSLLKIRTFLEHRAHVVARGRSVIIEDRGPLALLFLNNNLHAVHHMHPGLPWYRLPATYRARREHYLRRNDGYLYASYMRVFRDYFLRRKDPVAHPIWPVAKEALEKTPAE